MKIAILAHGTQYVNNFRGNLIKDILAKGNEVVVISPGIEHKAEVESLGVKVIITDLDKTSTGIIGNIKYYNNLVKILKEEKPDKVLSYTIKPVIFGSIASKKAKIKEIYALITGTGYVYTGNNLKVRCIRFICNLLYKKAFKYCNKVMFQNKDDRDQFIGYKLLSKDKTEIINGSGVNMQKFKKSDINNDNINFLMMARIIKNKGIYEYLKAAKIVKEKYSNVTFSLIGALDKGKDAIKYDDIKEYIDNNIVKYPGKVKDVREYINKCSVYVLPSYREGVPRSTLEAMSMGKPIITTKAVGCKETVIEDKNGFLVDIGDYKGLAEKMLYFIENKAEVEKMGNVSYEICRNKFDVKIINKKMMEIMKI